MRVAFVVYGVLYVVVEMVGYQLEAIGWPRITALDVAGAVVDALLWVALVAAVLVGLDVAADRWRRHRRELGRAPLRVPSWRPGHRWADGTWEDGGAITVTAWRSPVLALPAGSPPGTDDEAPQVRLL